MKPGDDCGICYSIITLHCELHGEPFCDLRREYLTTDMDGDTLIQRAAELATADQAEAVLDALQRFPIPSPDQIQAEARHLQQAGTTADPGAAAAARWLDHWRHGTR
jgi:hypothetical protein